LDLWISKDLQGSIETIEDRKSIEQFHFNWDNNLQHQDLKIQRMTNIKQLRDKVSIKERKENSKYYD
jgi:hypothetical protein